jgi:Gram-negative porin
MRNTVAAGVAALFFFLPIGLGSHPVWSDDAATPCCAALDQLLSGLTVAPSGGENSGHTLRLYGQLNRAVLYWDDGKKSRAYAVNNETSSSRLGLVGTHRFVGELSAGYRIEIDSRVTSSSEVSSGDPWGDLSDGAIRLRHANWYVEGSKLGRLTFGQQSSATDDIALIRPWTQLIARKCGWRQAG